MNKWKVLKDMTNVSYDSNSIEEVSGCDVIIVKWGYYLTKPFVFFCFDIFVIKHISLSYTHNSGSSSNSCWMSIEWSLLWLVVMDVKHHCVLFVLVAIMNWVNAWKYIKLYWQKKRQHNEIYNNTLIVEKSIDRCMLLLSL